MDAAFIAACALNYILRVEGGCKQPNTNGIVPAKGPTVGKIALHPLQFFDQQSLLRST